MFQLGSISAVSRVRSLILPGGWVRAHFPEQPSLQPTIVVNNQ